jgi:peptide deformylase
MAIRPICITGDPVLHNPAQDVAKIDVDIRAIVREMYETMDKAPGVGLAAPQIGLGLNIFVYDYEYQGEQLRGVAINPRLEIGEISPDFPDEETEVEGCLSVPGERFPLKRAEWAKLTALDLEGNSYTLEVTGWMARIFQHEFDHLQGVLYVDRLIEPYASEVQEVIQELGWGTPGLAWLPGQDFLEP